MSNFEIELAERIKGLPKYLFAKIDEMKQEALDKGMDIIDLGVGDPDLPTFEPMVKKLKEAVDNPENHRYPSYLGLFQFRQAVADWYKKRFNVSLDPQNEVLSLIGSKEGIGHIHLAFINPGDIVLVPNPAYPVYKAGTILAGGTPYIMPLLKENGFLPDLSSIPTNILSKAKLMFINYPNNPTSAVADRDFFTEVIKFARENNIIICHDAAYSEMAYEGYKPLSFLEIEGAKEVGIEFHSLSKTYNMAGWRIGFAVGNKKILSGLGTIKTNLDSGIFQAVQYAGIEALTGPQDNIAKMNKIYQERRDVLVNGLKEIGLNVDSPKATFYIWIAVPKKFSSADFTALLLEKAGVLSTPGNGFGKYGEGYVRMALTVDKKRLKEVIERIKKLNL